MSRRVRFLLATIALLAMALLPACYTLFRHPRLEQLDYRRPDSDHCQTCHASGELWYFTHPAAIPEHPGAWGEFYDRPWWFERRWKVGADSTAAREEQAP